MLIEFDEQKRQKTLAERGMDYGENRYISMGYINQRLMVCVWTYRPDEIAPTHRRIISMRKANDREIKRFNACI